MRHGSKCLPRFRERKKVHPPMEFPARVSNVPKPNIEGNKIPKKMCVGSFGLQDVAFLHLDREILKRNSKFPMNSISTSCIFRGHLNWWNREHKRRRARIATSTWNCVFFQQLFDVIFEEDRSSKKSRNKLSPNPSLFAREKVWHLLGTTKTISKKCRLSVKDIGPETDTYQSWGDSYFILKEDKK